MLTELPALEGLQWQPRKVTTEVNLEAHRRRDCIAIAGVEISPALVESFARLRGVTATDGKSVLDRQSQLSQMVGPIRSGNFSSYAGMWLDESTPIWTLTVNVGPSADAEALKQAASQLNVDLVGARLILRDVSVTFQQADSLTADLNKVGLTFDLLYDQQQASMSIRTPQPADVGRALQSLAMPGVPVSASYVAPKLFNYGGGNELWVDYSRSCTVGFAVKNGSGQYGFITAGHCAEPIAGGPIGTATNNIYSVEGAWLNTWFANGIHDAYNDYAILGVYGDTAQPCVYIGSPGCTPMSGASWLVPGSWVWKYGIASNLTWGQVTSNYCDRSYTGSPEFGLSNIDGYATGGDSGGPISPGSTGSAVVHGTACDSQSGYSAREIVWPLVATGWSMV